MLVFLSIIKERCSYNKAKWASNQMFPGGFLGGSLPLTHLGL